jgi:predicted  nucleic acid-binding Zn-ribbon protein
MSGQTPKPPVPGRPQIPNPQKPGMPPQGRDLRFTPRPGAVLLRPGAAVNPVRAQQQEAKRDAMRQLVGQALSRPQPTVRPAAPPQKVMPQQPTITPAPAARPHIPIPPKPALLAAAPRPVMPQIPMPSKVTSTPPKSAAAAAPAVNPVAPAQAVGFQKLFEAAKAASAAGADSAAALSVNTATVDPQITTEVNALQSSLNDLQRRSTFADLHEQIIDLEKEVSKVTSLLESARSKGYAFQKDLDDTIYRTTDQWQVAREKALNMIPQQVPVMQRNLSPLQNQLQQVNATLTNSALARPLIARTQSQINNLLSTVNQIESNIRSSYTEVESNVSNVSSRLSTIHWALMQLDEATYKLAVGEDLVMAVKARWDQEGDDDPEGILYLTDKRLIFERKEKVATKKVLFVTVSSQMVHEVMIDQPLGNLQGVNAQNKGLFGHQDFIEVQFSDPKLKLVSFHLDGQDSKQWAKWIDDGRLNRLDDDRASGSGLSYADLTGPLTPSDVMNLQTEVNALQEQAMLASVEQELTAIENDVVSMSRKLADLRARGYAIEKALEADVTILTAQWDRIKLNAQKTMEQQRQLMSGQMQSIQQMLAQLVGQMNNLAAARPLYMQTKSSAASAQAQAEAAQSTVVAQYDGYANEIGTLSAHLEWVGWMLDALATATFQLLATESGVAAVEAVYARPGLEPENGILFLTDQRILWEDRVGEFELKLNVPLQQVTDVQKAVSEGGQQEFLDFTFGPGAPCPNAHFQLGAPVADSWLKMVGRARSGGYAGDRAIEIPPEELERIRNAPQQCSKCGAALTDPILRGQVDVTCEYCGNVMHI